MACTPFCFEPYNWLACQHIEHSLDIWMGDCTALLHSRLFRTISACWSSQHQGIQQTHLGTLGKFCVPVPRFRGHRRSLTSRIKVVSCKAMRYINLLTYRSKAVNILRI